MLALSLAPSTRVCGCNWSTSPVRKLSAEPWSARMSSAGPLYDLISSDASYSFPASTDPRYPVNALCPQGQPVGWQIGANAEHDLYFPGFFSADTSAPCPPILCPITETRLVSMA